MRRIGRWRKWKQEGSKAEKESQVKVMEVHGRALPSLFYPLCQCARKRKESFSCMNENDPEVSAHSLSAPAHSIQFWFWGYALSLSLLLCLFTFFLCLYYFLSWHNRRRKSLRKGSRIWMEWERMYSCFFELVQIQTQTRQEIKSQRMEKERDRLSSLSTLVILSWIMEMIEHRAYMITSISQK